ncbi:MAG: c-type cytochrome domain-containing protein, partial [Planctomycetales bacterium]
MKIVRAKLLVLFGVAAPFGVAALTAAPLETCSAAEPSGAAAPVDYNRQIRPLLSNLCFRCHGPDANERQSGLRLDVRDQALEPAESGKRAIVPGKPEQSRLLDRIFSTDPGEVMPPPETNKTLSDADKELLKRWIAEGAQYREHWAFVPPRRPPEPPVTQRGWAKNAIDRFILARLEQSGLRPSPQADRATLIRRVTLDLTGLPPTP